MTVKLRIAGNIHVSFTLLIRFCKLMYVELFQTKYHAVLLIFITINVMDLASSLLSKLLSQSECQRFFTPALETAWQQNKSGTRKLKTSRRTPECIKLTLSKVPLENGKPFLWPASRPSSRKAHDLWKCVRKECRFSTRYFGLYVPQS